MTEFKYPSSELDRAETLLSTLGSFWRQTYENTAVLQDTLVVKASISQQRHLDLLELISATSRRDIPVFHKEYWHFLSFRASELVTVSLPKHRFDDGLAFDDSSKSTFDSLDTSLVGVKLPDSLVDVSIIVNRIVGTSLTLTKNIDFVIRDGFILFRENPFNSPLVARRDVWDAEAVVDQETGLWLFKSDWDWQTLYSQFGYSIGLQMASSEPYKALLNAVMDAFVEGTKLRDLHYAWSAVTGIPLVQEKTEIVELVAPEAGRLVVVTDKHCYQFHPQSTAIVSEGQVLKAGDPLVDSLQFFTFTSETSLSQIAALATGPRFLGHGYLGELTWENKTVDVVIEATESETDPRISWELGGYPGDVELFWDKANTVVPGFPSLAACLMAKYGGIPQQINPLQFLGENVFRNNLFVVRVKPTLFENPLQLGLQYIDILRKIIPPNLATIVLVDLKFTDQTITLTEAGTDTTPGYTESQLALQVAPWTEELTPDQLTERVRAFQIRGQCV